MGGVEYLNNSPQFHVLHLMVFRSKSWRNARSKHGFGSQMAEEERKTKALHKMTAGSSTGAFDRLI